MASLVDWESMESSLVEQMNWVGLNKMATDWLAQEPGNYRAWLALGKAQLSLDEDFGAVESFSKAVTISPNDKDGWYLLAAAYGKLGYMTSVISAFMKGLELDPDPEAQEKLNQLKADPWAGK